MASPEEINSLIVSISKMRDRYEKGSIGGAPNILLYNYFEDFDRSILFRNEKGLKEMHTILEYRLTCLDRADAHVKFLGVEGVDGRTCADWIGMHTLNMEEERRFEEIEGFVSNFDELHVPFPLGKIPRHQQFPKGRFYVAMSLTRSDLSVSEIKARVQALVREETERGVLAADRQRGDERK